MTDTVRYVNTDSSGGDGTTNATSGGTAAYASLAAAEAAEAGTIASGDRLIIYCDSPSNVDDTSAVSFDSASWTVTGDLIIQNNNGQGSPAGVTEHNGQFDTGYVITGASRHGEVFNVQTPNTTVEGLEVRNTNTQTGSGTCYRATDNDSIDSLLMKRCLAVPSAQKRGFAYRDPSGVGGIQRFQNCISAQGGLNGFAHTSNGNANIEIINCGVEGASVGYNTGSSSTVLCINCWSFNNTTSWASNTWNSSCSNNATDETDTTNVPGSSNQANLVSGDFESSSTDDYRVASGSGVLKDNGSDQSGKFSDDIKLDTRTGSWDIGPFELIVAGGAFPFPGLLNRQTYKTLLTR